jgi:hypothetical protein
VIDSEPFHELGSYGYLDSMGVHHTWPLTVDRGTIVRDQYRVFFRTPSGREYALNGIAASAGYADITPIWKIARTLGDSNDPDRLVIREWLGELTDIGNALGRQDVVLVPNADRPKEPTITELTGVISTEHLLKEFDENEAATNEKYANKRFSVTGRIDHVNPYVVGVGRLAVLRSTKSKHQISCFIWTKSSSKAESAKVEELRAGQDITVKGHCNPTPFANGVMLLHECQLLGVGPAREIGKN